MAVTVLWRVATALGAETESDGSKLAGMPDVQSVSSWALNAAEWAVDAKVITGVPCDGVSRFEPGRTVLREEMAKIVRATDSATEGTVRGWTVGGLEPAMIEISGSAPGATAGSCDFALVDALDSTVATASNSGDGTFSLVVSQSRTGISEYRVVPLNGITEGWDEIPVRVVTTLSEGVLHATVDYPEGKPVFQPSETGNVGGGSSGGAGASGRPETPDNPEAIPEDSIIATVKGDDACYGAGVYITGFSEDARSVTLPATIKGVPIVSISLDEQSNVTSLDASACSESLRSLSVVDGPLRSLDLDGCSNLANISCKGNVISELDLSDCASAETVDCSDNCISKLILPNKKTNAHTSSLENPPLLSILDCSNNHIKEIDVTGLPNLRVLDCSYNLIEDTSALESWASVEGRFLRFQPQFWTSDQKVGLIYEKRYSDDGSLEVYVTGTSDDFAGEALVVPGTIDGLPVVGVRLGGLSQPSPSLVDVSGCGELEELDLSLSWPYEGARIIADGCGKLTRALVHGATGETSFAGCASLKELSIFGGFADDGWDPDEPTYSGLALDLEGCTSLEWLDVSDSACRS